MTDSIRSQQKPPRAVIAWLWVGVAMIVIQVILGGITRLTGSGLSITEWKPIVGAFPPTSESEWLAAFEKYKQIPQFSEVNAHFNLQDFKFIYFWEWLHRLWARLFAIAFIIPFAWFYVKKMIPRQMVRPLVILFLLGALQGFAGWFMVSSGLSKLSYVSHYRLAVHFILALLCLCYTLWLIFSLTTRADRLCVHRPLRKFSFFIACLLVVQLVYGAFMAGLKTGSTPAAVFAPTWPKINGSWVPEGMLNQQPALRNIADNPVTLHFIHRGLAYLLAVLIFTWTYRVLSLRHPVLKKWAVVPSLLVLLQIILGVFTVMQSVHYNLYEPLRSSFVWLGVAHQFTAMCLVMVMTWVLFVIRSKPGPPSF
jgi:heme a synthase